MSTSMTLKLSASFIRDAAMRQSGISPQAMALKPGTRVQRNRWKEAKAGRVKHKAAHWD